MIRRSALLAALAALLCGTPLQAGHVRLVLDNGYVLPLNADGSAFDGEFGKLALRGEQRIHAIEPDYATGRLYVTLAGPQPHYLTQVYDLASLKLLDSLDDVVAVFVPDTAGTKTLLMHAYRPRDGRDPAGSGMLPQELATSGDLLWQQRDRRRPARVLAEGPEDGVPVLPRCNLGGSLPFLTPNPYLRLDRHFTLVSSPDLVAARERSRQERQWRLVQACLDDGETLEALSDLSPRSAGSEGLYPVSALVRRRGEKVLARYETPAALLPVMGDNDARRLGRDGRRIALIGLGVVLDLTDGTLTESRIAGPPWLQRSADGETLYSQPRFYVHRDIVADDYLFGSSPVFTGGVDRLSVAGGPLRRDKLPLPAELQELLTRQDAQSQTYRAQLKPHQVSVKHDGAEADAELPRLEPSDAVLTPLQQRLGAWITIIGVLDD